MRIRSRKVENLDFTPTAPVCKIRFSTFLHYTCMRTLISPPALVKPLSIDRVRQSRDNTITATDIAGRLWQHFGPVRNRALALSALGPHVYDGTSGIALFLAGFSSVTKDAEAGRLAVRFLAPLASRMRMLRAAIDHAADLPIAIGGMIGLGSFIYSFTRVATWLGDDDLLDCACAAAELITRERILADERLDVMTGCAGTLLGLLALHSADHADVFERERALDLAFCCGRRLLSARAPYASGLRAWPGVNRPPISGFAHGAAGISYALARLFEATGQPAFRDAALEGFAFERSLYDAHANNWLDPRFNRPVEQSAWCHGAPGMALARLHSLRAMDTAELRNDIEIAVTISRKTRGISRDHLCCGTSGRIEILSDAGEILGRPELLDDANGLSARMLARAAGSDFSFGDDVALHPSLFMGLAGIGYTLLRLDHPRRFPCLLALE